MKIYGLWRIKHSLNPASSKIGGSNNRMLIWISSISPVFNGTLELNSENK